MKVLLNIVCRIFVVLELPREEKNLILDYLQSVIFCFVTTQRAITRYVTGTSPKLLTTPPIQVLAPPSETETLPRWRQVRNKSFSFCSPGGEIKM